MRNGTVMESTYFIAQIKQEFLLLSVVQFHVRVHYAMELLRRMMDSHQAGKHHAPSACPAGLDCPQTNPAVYFLRFSIWTSIRWVLDAVAVQLL
jgi:hypothetical protein